jgi:hypothetical protein
MQIKSFSREMRFKLDYVDTNHRSTGLDALGLLGWRRKRKAAG